VLAALALVAGGVWAWSALAVPDEVDAPRRLSAKPVSPTGVVLSWKGDKKADGYVVTIGSDRTLTKGARTITSRTTKVELDDLALAPDGGERYYRIEAIDKEAEEPEEAVSRTGHFTLMPGTPGKVDVKKVSSGGASVAWKSVPNARQFDVVTAQDKAFTKEVSAVRTLDTDTDFVTDGLAPRTKYWMKVRAVNADHDGAFSEPASFTTRAEQTSFRVASWNVCSEVCNGYEGRARTAAAFLNASKVDVFGLQEAGGKRVGRTTQAVFTGGSQGFVRASGGTKTRYIFYRPELFEEVKGESFWIGGNKYATWVQLKIKKTGRQFIFVDIHLTNGKSKGKDSLRGGQLRRALSGMAARNTEGLPIIYAGDFNSGKHRPQDTPGRLMREAGLPNALDIAKKKLNAQYNTAHDFSPTMLASGAHIDHIYTSKDFAVLEWQQLVRASGGRYVKPYVSDHNPISAIVALDDETSVGDPTPTTPVPGLDASTP
jgi:endonuclease/exonuclease/phosphatase family metal-dependent hydrolase